MNDTVTLPIGWILGIIGTLGGVISMLAGLIWSIMKSRLEAQDTIIAGLRTDIERMAKGCGAGGCLWKNR
jgi:hypothetical protein